VTAPQHDPQPDPVLAAQGLTAAVGSLAEEVGKLRTSQRRSWKVIAFDITLTIGLGIFGFVAAHAAQSASSAQAAAKTTAAYQRTLCELGNQARAQQKGDWQYIIGMSPPPKAGTPAAQRLARFEQHLKAHYAPRDCSHLTG
jgi:hypothetical protein